ncbi:MAG: GNAT family N-acetyltransferase [Planctomycetota bacterium]
MLIRRLERHDAEAYRALMLAAYALEPEAFTATVEERRSVPLDFWEARIESPDGDRAAFGLFASGELMGAVALEFSRRPRTAHRGRVVGMFVAPEVRGAGHGRALFESALAAARARPGLAQLILTVTENNDVARRFYARFGFEAFGVEPMAVRTETGFLRKVHLSLILDGEERRPVASTGDPFP